MTNRLDSIVTPERKVWAASLATFVGTTAILGILSGTVTDLVPSLPDLLEAPAYALLQAVITFVFAYRTKNVADSLSPSTRDAVQEWLRRKGIANR